MSTAKCQRVPCQGTIDDDGFCVSCGMPPEGASSRAADDSSGDEVAGWQPPEPPAGEDRARPTTQDWVAGWKSKRVSIPAVIQRKKLGLGLVEVPPVLISNPSAAGFVASIVPEDQRVCSKCAAKLHRSDCPHCKKQVQVVVRNDKHGPITGHCRECNKEMFTLEGACPYCAHPYCFRSKLKKGDVLARKYEVQGCLAFGGMSRIYLAKDRDLDRFVVLKDVLDPHDKLSVAEAADERRYLASIKHENIVAVHNYIEHDGVGYIVMEYIGGKTIKDIRRQRGPLPPAEGIAIVYALAEALKELHNRGLIYCDFKPDNGMMEGDTVKLIDLGGVRPVNSSKEYVQVSKGYVAPEGVMHPSVVGDIFTIGRTLAVLVTRFEKLQGMYEYTLPTPAEEPLYAQFDSLYQFLLRCTMQNPDERFQTVAELQVQLRGVLQEVVAAKMPGAPPFESQLFEGDALGVLEAGDPGDGQIKYTWLPQLKINPADPAGARLQSCSALQGTARTAAYEQVANDFPDSVEAALRLAEVLIDNGNYQLAAQRISELAVKDPFDWRPIWYLGKLDLARGNLTEALNRFRQVYSQIPGELGPKLAVAMVSELAGDYRNAGKFYEVVSRTDARFVTAIFGLGRCLARQQRKVDAVQAYRRVPRSSRFFTSAQIAIVSVLVDYNPHMSDLQEAAGIIKHLELGDSQKSTMVVEFLRKTLDLLKSRKVQENRHVQVLGSTLDADSVALALEAMYRALARSSKTEEERIELVEQANAVRPWTTF